jgi:hypothetical protein
MLPHKTRLRHLVAGRLIVFIFLSDFKEMNKTPHGNSEPTAPLPYGSIGREFFLGSRMKNAEKLFILLRDALEIMDRLSEEGWAITGQRVVEIMGLKNARAWAGYFNSGDFAAHMHTSVRPASPRGQVSPASGSRWTIKRLLPARRPPPEPADADVLVVETETAQDLYKCVNFLTRNMRSLSRTVAGVTPGASTREGYTWYPLSSHSLMRAYDIPCVVHGDFVYANIANKESEIDRRQDLLAQGKAIHFGFMNIMRYSHLPSYFSSEQLPVYDSDESG